MAKIKKAQMDVKQPPVKKKSLTDMQRDEMGKPVSPAQKSKNRTAQDIMVNYPGRPAMSEINYKGGPKVKKKMKTGGSLKPVDASKQKGLSKLPKEVRNKMGYQKTGGKTKAKTGASVKSPKKAMGGMSMTKMANMKKGGKCKYGCK